MLEHLAVSLLASEPSTEQLPNSLRPRLLMKVGVLIDLLR